jgi:predicted ribosomally synthesized peptide with SipW-like signal peptide
MKIMNHHKTSYWALASVGFGIVAAVVLLLAGYGYQWDWWGLGTAFTWLLPGSGVVALIGFSLAVVFGFSRWKNPVKKGASLALLGVVLSLAVMGTLGYWYDEAQQYPPIHDISTDIENPPEFSAIVPLRADAPNDTTYGDQEKADTQREHYPDIQTFYLDVEYNEAFDRALQAAEQRPWEQIVTADKESGIIEAVDKLPWFGFIDDVVIRIDTTETPGRSKIDVRSVSRLGQGDIGVNAHRIREYLEEVQNQ